uniref:putative ubiquitin-conjugating enzyme E2 38 n=1 Tax=Erigeron canadensis TaxID=72917 RepID=UPI001CB95E5F|nr:putative ubiquitin-conjugating enzyme E2 38 [Erigeron canadensis]
MEQEYQYYCIETSGEVVKVLIKDGMYVKEGQPMFVIKTQILSRYAPKPLSDEFQKSMYKKSIESLSHFPPDVFPNVDKIFEPEEQHIASSSLIMADDDDDVMKRYANFKKFDIVKDHSDHLFSSYTCAMKHVSTTIKQERRILEQHLPRTIFVRACESRMDLLRAVIIGPEGTPYHHGLFFFDVFFPNKYPYIPPLVRYHSIGLCISPNMNMCGEVCFSLLDTDVREENLWVPGTTMLQLLVSIQDLIFNTKPYFSGIANAMTAREYLSLLYNENTIIKSLKIMVHTMNKPPKNFEDFVVGHFRTRVGDIKMACKAYMEGLQLGCLVSDVTCSIEFKNDVASCIKSLLDGFDKIGAKGAQEFLSLIEKRSIMDDEPTNYALDKKRKLQDIETGHGPDDHYVPWSWTVTAYTPCLVTKVLVKEGMKVKAQQPVCQ